MKNLLAAVLLTALFATSCSRSTPSTDGSPTPVSDADLLARGRYLVDHVGLCADCHTPRNADGSLDTSRWLAGAPVDFKPVHPMPWAAVAPPLAGLVGFTEAQALDLLMHGKARTGQPPLPPMPKYAFTEPDARAVIRYLRSLRLER